MTNSKAPLIATLDDLPPAFTEASTWYLDTEFMRERTFYAELALVQIAVGDQILLLDAPKLSDSERQQIGELLASKQLVLHACSEDLDVLTHTTGKAPTQLTDTQLAAALTGLPLQMSYQKLVLECCQVDLPKEATRSNWLKRPLSDSQLAYAADDVRYLAEVHRALLDKLEAQGRLGWLEEESRRLVQQLLSTTAADQLWKQVKGVGNLQGQALAYLRQLAQWRDQQARRRNLPRSFVIADRELLAICEQPPTSRNQLQQLGLHPGLIRRHGDTLLQLIEAANQQQPPAPLPGPPTAEQRATIKHWRKQAHQIAEALELDPSVLIRRRWLEALARNQDTIPEPLTGWRYEVITRELLDD